jgi:hypothetical protein
MSNTTNHKLFNMNKWEYVLEALYFDPQKNPKPYTQTKHFMKFQFWSITDNLSIGLLKKTNIEPMFCLRMKTQK